VHAQVAAINEELNKETITVYEGTEREFTMKNDLEIVCGDLMNEWHQEKEVKKVIKKVAYVGKGGDVCTVNMKQTSENLDRVKKQKWWDDSYTLLNTMPIEQAKKNIL